ncbi:retrovirus-related Pol polyprotein from transposon opus [Trichonephila clavipes]|nr:retrovirus-related Pol polyprotein from transposon opus [Trichonephila clavipes]
MSSLDLRSEYFQMAVSPSDIVKTAFVTKNGTYAFRRMPFGLSGAAPNFQKAIDIILKPVIGKFVSVYMDDVIISSPSFTQHVKYLKKVFRLLHEAGLTLNKDKCKFGCEELKYFGLIINKEGIKTDEAKVQAIVEMKPPHNSKVVSKCLGMSQWHKAIRHVKTVVYRPQANRTERVNRDLVQMIANYVNEQHDTWDQFLREFAYAIQISDGIRRNGICSRRYIEKLFEEARRNTETTQEKWKKYYNRRRRDVQIKVRIYRHRKCDETEIGTGNSDNGSLRDESSGFDRVQRRSNDSRDKKKESEVKRELEEKGLSFRNNQGEKHTNKTKKRGPLIRSIPSSWSGGPERKVQKGSVHRVNKRALSSNYRTNHSLTKFRKKSRRVTVTPTTSGYNLRPRIGKREESRPTIERKTQQGGPVRSRKGRERNDSPYIEERTRSSNKNARRGGDQQRQDQERRGTCTKKSFSLEVLVGNANYKS